ncbi:hypothetical protein [Haloferax gibbonsii]|uniref:Uncharacterized protein n=1 Tax=Haloferax gibbonsii TaxID=35746 RepID=A0A0K1IUS0_HALGI|nr:hypothetical protein [Haloferax gibbonsii]AKU08282.1 hypothetical protein ABY42_11270 [Haloferax gibbonsii]
MPLGFIGQNLETILTGLSMMVIGGWLYEARDGFFLSGGSFRNKYESLVILLVSVVAVSMMTPFIEQFWTSIVNQYGSTRILGVGLILGMVAVNDAAEWTFTDAKSLSVYAVGALFVLKPELVQSIL